MDDRFNTIAGWVLGAGIVALGGTLVTGEFFKHEHHAKGGWEVADATPTDEPPGMQEPTDFSKGDPVKGEAGFKKCTQCHTVAAGGPNGTGPNLFGVMGKKHAGVAGFAYSPDLAAMPGSWGWAEMDKWLANPKKYVPKTKMSFAGIGKASDRADLIVYLNAQGSNLPVPPPPVAAAAPAGPETPATAATASPASGAPTADQAASNSTTAAPAAATGESKGAGARPN